MRERNTDRADLELNVQVGIEIEKERYVEFRATVKDGTDYIYKGHARDCPSRSIRDKCFEDNFGPFGFEWTVKIMMFVMERIDDMACVFSFLKNTCSLVMVLGLELPGEKDDLCFLVLGLDPNPSKLFEILFEFKMILSVKKVINLD
ncbi:hypothetical protein NC652_026582 [Populus alba x Populus x berolinensis]|uniref:Uncharacterized protein n=1 Tax=Populus alba x Populus x berolinensis TaxID=444605 RepID=A0AAD6MD44_9ROSI|nr:hypothetical protein NC652_026575 [Populus alba x Populus x berolinensis]KAJ6900518.1 hypothetical protein NC652_026582 [Populus alba x Populus x berolinensis]KAJ6983260.1 hypothetical protein NC653_026160 [Populus alba x Populus x berolinensis]